MQADAEFWNREELYEEVWATPMKLLATKYGLSDVGLAKVCHRLAIPVPGRGYWEKKKAGHEVIKAPLLSLKEEFSVPKPMPRPELIKLSDIATELEINQIERLVQTPHDELVRRGCLSHPLIIETRSILKEAMPDDRKVLRTRNDLCLDIRVSKSGLEPGLRCMAKFIRVIETAGFNVSVKNHWGRQTVATIHGQQIRFALLEKIDRIDLPLNTNENRDDMIVIFRHRPVRFEPAGTFRIQALESCGRSRLEWADKGTKTLEEQFPRILATFIRMALKDRAKAEQRAAEEREQQREAEERARLEEAIKAQEAKVRTLKEETAKWVEAGQIRSFITASRAATIRQGQSVAPGSSFSEWEVWAHQQADRLDPLQESQPSIIDRKEELEPTPLFGPGTWT